MAAPRATPFSLVFGELAERRFPALKGGLAEAGRDPRDRDAFLLVREVVELLHELRPDGGLGEGMAALAGFLHHAYLYWADGQRLRVVPEEALAAALHDAPGAGTPGDAAARYIQLPPLKVWGTPEEGAPAEPLDGWFVHRLGDRLTVLAAFGLRPGRDGLTVVEVHGTRAAALARPDGSSLFAPSLEGGARMNLASIAGEEELLELAWRIEDWEIASGLCPSQ
ncbi:MAG: hypothetical protein HOP28_11610 [Gemmatimonadales bacterium]|nr:hypothetical protein [Gemmatimonadales bacterium]